MASTQAAARSQWQPCPFTLPYWSITCHRCLPRRVERRARPRPLPCLEIERGSGRHTARARKATGERGVRGNWCSWQTEGGGKEEKRKMGVREEGRGKGGRVAEEEACSLLADSQRRRMEDEQGQTGWGLSCHWMREKDVIHHTDKLVVFLHTHLKASSYLTHFPS